MRQTSGRGWASVATLAVLALSLGGNAASEGQPESAAAAVARDPEVRAALAEADALLAAKLEEHRLPGMSAVVVCGQDVLWAKGYGYADLEQEIPATPNTVYDVGSVSKVFTATALMILRDAGVVTLDDPVEKHLPEFQVQRRPDDAGPPTLKHLAAHMAGLPHQPAGIEVDAWPPLEEALIGLRTEDLFIPTFSDRKYSNVGFGVLGNALGRAAGRPYTDYVREHIFVPLGMRSSAWVATDEMKEHLAVGYDPIAEDGTRGRSLGYEPGEGGAPAGGLLTSARDMARFMSAYLYEGPAGDGHILAGSTVRELRHPVFVARGWKFGQGIGWMFWPDGEGRTIMAHGGGRPGFTAKVNIVPDLRLGVFVAINERAAIDSVADPALWVIAPAVAAAWERWEAAQPPPPLPAGLEPWLGLYELDPPVEGQRVELALEEGWLRVFVLEKGERAYPARLVPLAEATFRVQGGPSDGEKVVLERDPASGQVLMQIGGFTVVKAPEEEND